MKTQGIARVVLATCAAAAVALAASTAPATPWGEQTKLTASDGVEWDRFGVSVSLSGDHAVIGSSHDDDLGSASGSAYVFQRDATGWTEVAKLRASDGSSSDHFGHSVSISGDCAVAGAYQAGGVYCGSAYAFRRTAQGWTQEAKLTASDATAEDWFGISLSVDADYAVIGAPQYLKTGNGTAYVFEHDAAGWTQAAKLTASDGAPGDDFGYSVAILGSLAVVGAFRDDDAGTSSGSAYVFERDTSGWGQREKLMADDAVEGAWFGTSVAVSGDCIVVGATRDSAMGDRSGSAYVFERDASGWTQVAKLVPSDGSAYDRFGEAVAISGAYILVGAYGDDDSGGAAGSAYVFERGPSGWTQAAKLLPADGEGNDYFGCSVSVDGACGLIGACQDDRDTGSAYIFVPEPATLGLLALGGLGLLRRRRRG